MSKSIDETGYSKEQVQSYVNSISWEKRLKREIPFLGDLFRKHGYKNILDLGCGPGKHAIELARNNSSFKVTGIDIDEQMIAYAKSTSKESGVEFECIDIFKKPPENESKFDAVYTLGNALMIIWTSFLTDEKENGLLEVFQALSHLLKPNGGLFFQILNSDNPRDGHVISKITTVDGNKKHMLVKHFIPIESESRLYTTFSTLEWTNETEPQIKSTRKSFLHLIPLDSLKTILQKAGFSTFEFFENYAGEPFKKGSSDSLMCFAKKINFAK